MRLNGLNSVFFCYNFLVFFSHVEGKGGGSCVCGQEKKQKLVKFFNCLL